MWRKLIFKSLLIAGIFFSLSTAWISPVKADPCVDWCACFKRKTDVCLVYSNDPLCDTPHHEDCCREYDFTWICNCCDTCDPNDPLCENQSDCVRGTYPCNRASDNYCCPYDPAASPSPNPCFPANTKVKVKDGEKAIQSVEVGDQVVSQDVKGNQLYSEVTHLDQQISHNMCQLDLTDGENLRLTDNHVMSTTQGWKAINPDNARNELSNLSIAQLEEGDSLIRLDGKLSEISSIYCWSQTQETYNLVLGGSARTYFANGYLAHNKGECNPDLWSPCVPECDGGFEYSDCGEIKACTTPPCCTATAPTNLSATDVSINTANLTWTPGTGGTKQLLRLDESAAAVESGCPSGCLIKEDNLTTSTNSYTATSLSPDTNYYYRIVDYVDMDCYASAIANFDHWSVADSWYQVQGGNLHANGGGIYSDIPQTCVDDPSCDAYLITTDANGEAGAVSFQGSIDIGEVEGANLSQNEYDWNMETTYEGAFTGYDYFERFLQEDPVGMEVWEGEEPITSGVFKAEAPVTTVGSTWNISSGVIAVLLADGDVTIDSDINVVEGGFLAIISSGNINISSEVTHLEGVLIADGVLDTGSSYNQLTGEGIFVGWEGIDLNRDLDANNKNNPAELFIYRADLQANAHLYLLRPTYSWEEVAP